MNKEDVLKLWVRLRDEHNLNGWFNHWKLLFMRSSRILGNCNYKYKTIWLSEKFVELNDEHIVKDILLHEIAHALTKGHKHNKIFKAKAISIGCRNINSSVTDKINVPKGNFSYKCPSCNRITEAYRRYKRTHSCGDCCNKHNNRKFDKRFILVEVSR